MSGYRLVLFLHEAQLRAAQTAAAARPWAALMERAAKVFPPALLVLVVSGAYLVHRGWTWGSCCSSRGRMSAGSRPGRTRAWRSVSSSR